MHDGARGEHEVGEEAAEAVLAVREVLEGGRADVQARARRRRGVERAHDAGERARGGLRRERGVGARAETHGGVQERDVVREGGGARRESRRLRRRGRRGREERPRARVRGVGAVAAAALGSDSRLHDDGVAEAHAQLPDRSGAQRDAPAARIRRARRREANLANARLRGHERERRGVRARTGPTLSRESARPERVFRRAARAGGDVGVPPLGC